jgi:hypothetical protein
LEIDNTNPEYIERVQGAIDAMTCPSCGHPATAMAIGVHSKTGTYGVAPVFVCDTPACEFNYEGENAWTPVSQD